MAFPPNLTCTAESSTKIKLCWSKIPILLRRGIVRKRKLIFRNMNNTIPWSKETTSEHCTESVNLPEYSLFSIKIAAFTIDWGNYSETPVQCMTLEGGIIRNTVDFSILAHSCLHFVGYSRKCTCQTKIITTMLINGKPNRGLVKLRFQSYPACCSGYSSGFMAISVDTGFNWQINHSAFY